MQDITSQIEKAVFIAVDKAVRLHMLGLVKASPVPPEDLMSIDQAASFLHIAPRTLYNKINKRKIPFIKNGRKVLFSRKELTSWLLNGEEGGYHGN